jgi:uncharacterized protein (DUF433 family)
MNASDILNDFPELSSKQIQACFAYAADREHKTRVASRNSYLTKTYHFL